MTHSEDEAIREIIGYRDVVEWFGWWPDFHDAEVVSLLLDRERDSTLKIHFFNTSRELTKNGHYKTSKHAIVAVSMTNIVAINLEGFNNQNVVSDLLLTKGDDGFLIELGCCHGLCGSIRAKEIWIAVKPGMPTGSVYAATADIEPDGAKTQ